MDGSIDGYDEELALGFTEGALDEVRLGSMDRILNGTALSGFDEGLALDNHEGTTVGNFERFMIGSTFTAGETYPQLVRFTVTSLIRAHLFIHTL